MAKVKVDPIDLLMAQHGLTLVPPTNDQPISDTLPPPDPKPAPVSVPTPDDWRFNS